jgi:hypothetical protein
MASTHLPNCLSSSTANARTFCTPVTNWPTLLCSPWASRFSEALACGLTNPRLQKVARAPCTARQPADCGTTGLPARQLDTHAVSCYCIHVYTHTGPQAGILVPCEAGPSPEAIHATVRQADIRHPAHRHR